MRGGEREKGRKREVCVGDEAIFSRSFETSRLCFFFVIFCFLHFSTAFIVFFSLCFVKFFTPEAYTFRSHSILYTDFIRWVFFLFNFCLLKCLNTLQLLNQTCVLQRIFFSCSDHIYLKQIEFNESSINDFFLFTLASCVHKIGTNIWIKKSARCAVYVEYRMFAMKIWIFIIVVYPL